MPRWRKGATLLASVRAYACGTSGIGQYRRQRGWGGGAVAVANGACDGRDVLARHLAHVVRSLARHLIRRHGRRWYRRPRLPRMLRNRPAGDKPRTRGRSPTSLALHARGEPGPARIGVSPVPVQMWQRQAQSRRRCGGSGPSPGADVAAASRVPKQMWQRRAQSRSRCEWGGPSPEADVVVGWAQSRSSDPVTRLTWMRVILSITALTEWPVIACISFEMRSFTCGKASLYQNPFDLIRMMRSLIRSVRAP